jgi:hypothetical protein
MISALIITIGILIIALTVLMFVVVKMDMHILDLECKQESQEIKQSFGEMFVPYSDSKESMRYKIATWSFGHCIKTHDVLRQLLYHLDLKMELEGDALVFKPFTELIKCKQNAKRKEKAEKKSSSKLMRGNGIMVRTR